MARVHSRRRLGSSARRATKSLLAALACTTVACSGASEPAGWAASIVLRSEVPTGILDRHDAKRVYIGERLRDPIVVQALDPLRRPASRVAVKATASHGGLVAAVGGAADSLSGTVLTDATGMAAFWWTPGPAVDFQTLTISAPGAEDVVVRVLAFWPHGVQGKVTFADSALSVGESTTASLTFTTPAGEAIDYNGEVRWKVHWMTHDPRIMVVSGGDALTPDGSHTVTTGPGTITAVSPGRTIVSASISVAHSIGSEGGISGFDSVTVHPVCTLTMATPLVPGQSVNGLMTAQDCRLETGAPYDYYRLTVPIGQRVQLDLASTGNVATRYDPYLILLDANGNWVTGDDWSGGGTSARITFTAESTTYYLQATSLAPGVTGAYTLSAKPVP